MNKLVTAVVSAAVGVTIGIAVPAVADAPNSVCQLYKPYYAGESAYNHYHWAVGDLFNPWVTLTKAQQAPWVSAGSAAINNACKYDVKR